jgi:hypothetical protein
VGITEAELRQMLARGDACVAAGETLAIPPPVPRFLTLPDDAPEDALRSRIQALCKVTGHLYWHAKKSQQSTPGFPDDVIVHPDGGPFFLWELKRSGEEPRPAQRQWLDAARNASHLETGVYRPCDWARIYTLLTRRR